MMKKTFLTIAASFFLLNMAFASHEPLVKDKVYNFPLTSICEDLEPVLKFKRLFIEEGLPVARKHLQAMERTDKCGAFRGGARYLDTIEEWKDGNHIFRLLELSVDDGKSYYTIYGWENHEIGI